MHMADALVSPAVGVTMYAATAGAAALSITKLRRAEKASIDLGTASKLPVMAVMSALVFAAQMINYTIPGTGSSGHICGGMLLAALLGPYAAFLSMIVILAIQCLFFADGGLLALGANCWNMGFYGCFVGYFLVYRPIMASKLKRAQGAFGASRARLITASIVGCVLTLQLGALSVVIETQLSGITELPLATFLALMQPIHLAIGLVEGLITAAVLVFVSEARPELIAEYGAGSASSEVGSEAGSGKASGRLSLKGTIAILAIIVIVTGGGLSLLASSNPDGLEWSLFGNAESGYSENMGLDEEDYGITSSIAEAAESVQDTTAFLPDYAFAGDEDNWLGTSVSGILGSAMVALFAAIVCVVGGFFRKRHEAKESNI